MAKSKPTLRSRKKSREDRPAVTSSVAAGRKCAPLRISTQVTPTRVLRRRVNGRFAVPDLLPSYTPYQYTPLNEELNEVRLLTLHEGDFTAGVQVSIHTVPLMPENPPIYEALSYVWGSTENLTDIKVGNDCLAVTRNLAKALPYLRYKDKPRTLWIDAICVNQQDLKERGHQVKNMADLYRLANRVIVWLGPEKNHSDRGMRTLDRLSSQLEVDESTCEMKPASKEAEPHWSDDRRIFPCSYGELLAINEVLSRPWFERLWIQQEIRCANRNAIILCGWDMIAWQSLGRAISCRGLFCLKHKILSGRPLTKRAQLINSLVSDVKEFTLPEIMRDTAHCKCFDPRDRIYSVLSLLTEDHKALGIVIDYKKTTSQVYQDAALRYIDHHKQLDMLTSSGLRDKPSDMPTWVPDWTIKTFLPWGVASGNSVIEVSYRGGGVLSVTGTRVATVQHAERMKKDKGTEGLIREIRRVAPDNILRRSYVAGDSLLAAYCHTICASEFRDMHMPPRRDLPQFQQSKEFLFAILQRAEKRIPDYHSPGTEGKKFLSAAKFYCAERSFIETREDYIGLAPRIAQPGDQVCILLGCNKPMLLRPASDFQYQVIGACYIHGLMRGEALLGPLPGYYQVTRIWEERYRAYFPGFLNHQTGKGQYIDSRFEAPLENADGDQFHEWEHPDGSRSRLLTAKMLEKRGVSFQTFDLI